MLHDRIIMIKASPTVMRPIALHTLLSKEDSAIPENTRQGVSAYRMTFDKEWLSIDVNRRMLKPTAMMMKTGRMTLSSICSINPIVTVMQPHLTCALSHRFLEFFHWHI